MRRFLILLVSLETTGTGKENLKREAETCGVSGERLFFSGRRPKPEHLARHKMAGLFLDTRIYDAHCERHALGRRASHHLPWRDLCRARGGKPSHRHRTAGAHRRDLEAYEELAIALATDPPRLKALKEKLLTQRDRCPLFDTSRSARNLERAYLAMWARYEKGEAPDILIITEE